MNDNLWIDQKYINLLAPQLPKFKQVDKNTWNFRCVLCGDSETNPNKKRGYIFYIGGTSNCYMYKCHNCGAGLPFAALLKRVSPTLSDEYITEHFVNKTGKQLTANSTPWQPEIENTPVRRHQKFAPLNKLKKISQLKHDHPARKYVNRRKIPVDKHWMLYYCPNFSKWVNSIIPEKLNAEDKQPRLVIPFIDQDGYVFAVSGRSFKKDDPKKYISIVFDHSKPRLFGLNTVDWSKSVKIVEGPIDSLFLSNAIAMGTSNNHDITSVPSKENCTIVLDNQPRNKEIVRELEAFIEQGWKVCIWPESVTQKDINDMVKSGQFSAGEVEQIIDSNTFYDLVARIKLAQWRKV